MSVPRHVLVSVLVATVLATSACGRPAREPLVVRPSQLATMPPDRLDRPIVVVFEEGDVIPLRFTLDGPFMKTDGEAPTIPVRVVRPFFLRVDERGLHASVDGKNFDAKPAVPGSFRVGFGANDGKLVAEMEIHTPVPRNLPPHPPR